MTIAPPPAMPAWLETQLPFERKVLAIDGHRLHFVDDGVGRPVLLLHGNPTWCYLWRAVIGRLIHTGHRVIAPDLVGLGLSDKPRDSGIHTLDFHAGAVVSLIKALDLGDLVVAGQDWGGPIVALAAARVRDRVRGAVFANTALRVPSRPPRITAFHRFSHAPIISDLAFRYLNYPVRKLHLVQGDPASIGREQRRAYSYPLRRIRDRTAPLALARLVPHDLSSPVYEGLREVEEWASSARPPVRLVWGMKDPILGRSVRGMRELFPAADVVETDAGHFLQEEVPDELAAALAGLHREESAANK
jgi:haloalkane dehalogenase